jgi:Abnormal spindle-like microcephaly-assoc'd, ASPM-SPD-2-Hydin
VGAVIALEADNLGLTNRLSNVDFDEAALGKSVTKTLALRNSGTTPLTELAFNITGTDTVDFAIDTKATAKVILPGDGTTFSVTFKPTGKLIGVRNTTLTCLSGDTSVDALTVTLRGTATN